MLVWGSAWGLCRDYEGNPLPLSSLSTNKLLAAVAGCNASAQRYRVRLDPSLAHGSQEFQGKRPSSCPGTSADCGAAADNLGHAGNGGFGGYH